MAGAVGDDALAEVGLQNLKSAVNISRVSRVAEPTGSASIQIDAKGCNMIVVAAGANLAASSDTVEDDLLQRANIVLLRSEEHTSELQSLMRISYAVL